MNHRQAESGLLVAAVLLGASLAHGNGYRILCVKSAKATGMGEAFVTQADDPSALAFNPAGIAQLRGLQLNLGGTLCNAYTERRGPDGSRTDIEDKWQWVPSLFVTHDLGLSNVTTGIGVSLPNGLSSEWADDSYARYVGTYSDLVVGNVTWAVGVKVNQHLLLGAGLDFYYSKAELHSMVFTGGPDLKRKLTGSGYAWGANVGAIYRINDRHGVALVYRTPYTIDYDGGHLEVEGVMRSDVEASVDFPGVVTVGYGYKPVPKLKLEFNVDWVNWEPVDEITIVTPGAPAAAQRQDFDNAAAFKFGVEYEYSKSLTLRCGYIYNQNATPEEAWRPSLPDTDTHFFTAGFGYTWGNLTLDAALQLVYYETRRIDNDVDSNESGLPPGVSSVDGTYRTIAPCVSVGVTYRF
jgi:long-chain fatty acid transport protein